MLIFKDGTFHEEDPPSWYKKILASEDGRDFSEVLKENGLTEHFRFGEHGGSVQVWRHKESGDYYFSVDSFFEQLIEGVALSNKDFIELLSQHISPIAALFMNQEIGSIADEALRKFDK